MESGWGGGPRRTGAGWAPDPSVSCPPCPGISPVLLPRGADRAAEGRRLVGCRGSGVGRAGARMELGSASFPISLTFRLPVPFQPPSRCYGLPTVALGDSREQDKTPVPTCARPVRGTLVTTMPPDVL